MLDWWKFFFSINHYENIREIATCQGDDYTMGCLLDYAYFRDKYKIIAKNLIKIKH